MQAGIRGVCCCFWHLLGKNASLNFRLRSWAVMLGNTLIRGLASSTVGQFETTKAFQASELDRHLSEIPFIWRTGRGCCRVGHSWSCSFFAIIVVKKQELKRTEGRTFKTATQKQYLQHQEGRTINQTNTSNTKKAEPPNTNYIKAILPPRVRRTSKINRKKIFRNPEWKPVFSTHRRRDCCRLNQEHEAYLYHVSRFWLLFARKNEMWQRHNCLHDFVVLELNFSSMSRKILPNTTICDVKMQLAFERDGICKTLGNFSTKHRCVCDVFCWIP